MKLHLSRNAGIAIFSGLLLLAPGYAQQAKVDMTEVSPESEGFSSQRLERLHDFFQQTVDKKQVAGVVSILARHGKVVDYRAYGVKDLASGAPMTRDTIFRDYSMTKPVTGVAMMILFEEGKWRPADPIAKFIPEFAHLKVFNGYDAQGTMILVDPVHAPTMAELMTHTAGFTYGLFGDTAVDKMYRDANLLHTQNLQEMIDKLSKIPLLYQPGTQWNYSVSMDIQGYIVEKLTGQTLPDFMRKQIFEPLDMKDAGFYVPAGKRSRFATLYFDDGHANLQADTSHGPGVTDFASPPTEPSGGGGLVSTAEDYFHFAQMLANDGELDGVRILAPSTVKLMTANHLSPALLAGGFHIGMQTMRPGFGYGYDCAVNYDPQIADLPDGKGTFHWDGLAGTWFWVDPANDVVFIGMIQRIHGSEPNLEYVTHDLVYQALVDPAK